MAIAKGPMMAHPLADSEEGAEIRRLYSKAATEEEWRVAVARLVAFLISQSAPPSTLENLQFKFWSDKVFNEIQNGFRKRKRGRPSSITLARRDAWTIDLLLNEQAGLKTEAAAARRLAEYGKISLGAARQCVKRAQKLAGLELEKARPFGHK